MASHDDTYVHGTMEIADQSGTYKGFLVWATWGALLTSLAVLFLSLVFAGGQPWLGSLFGVAALGIVAGLAMKLGGAWFATVVGLTVVSLISGGIATVVGNFS
jgi:Bacterial aa3 type cytochrome c oxidase subunit IV